MDSCSASVNVNKVCVCSPCATYSKSTLCFSGVYFCAESFVPLWVGHRILLEYLETKLLVVHSCKSILVFRLPQDIIFNKLIQGQWIVGSANHIPFYVLLSFILQKLFAMSKNYLEPLSSMIFKMRISLSVGEPLVAVLSLLQVSHNYINVHTLFEVTLCNIIFQNC